MNWLKRFFEGWLNWILKSNGVWLQGLDDLFRKK
jgi:hypothetical protein